MSEYIKFTCEKATTEITPFDGFAELNACRRKLLQLRLIGVDANGIGFGNLSIRDGATNNFYITGSATGGKPELTLADCARVVAYDFEKNWLRYEGSGDSFIGVVDARRGLQVGCKGRGGDSLP